MTLQNGLDNVSESCGLSGGYHRKLSLPKPM